MRNVCGSIPGVVQQVIQRLYIKSFLISFFSLSVLMGCGGPPQNVVEGEEGPASVTMHSSSTSDFGTVPLAVNSTMTITLVNGSFNFAATNFTNTTTPSAPFSWFGGAYPGTGGTCGNTIPVQGSCTIVVAVNPPNPLAYQVTVDFTYDNGMGPANYSFDLTAQGRPPDPAVLEISDAPSYDFGPRVVGTNNDYVFTVTNTGELNATTVTFPAMTSDYSIFANTCGATIAPLASCNVTVRYSPTAIGPSGSTLTVDYFDSAANQSSSRPVSGTGQAPALLSISETDPYDFGIIVTGTPSAPHTFTVTNGGGVAATAMAEVGLAAPFGFLGGVYPGTGGTCGTTLAAGANCTLVIEFVPAGTGLSADVIDMNYNDGASVASATRAVEGTGGNAAFISISDGDPYDFGNVIIGDTANHTFTLTNTGALAATAMTGSGLVGAHYRFIGGTYPGTGGTCGTTLAPAANCTVFVEFTPVASGVLPDIMNIGYNNGAGAANSAKNLTGTGLTPALLTISETDPFNFPSTPNNGTANHNFTITNTGDTNATAIVEVGLAAPFSFLGGAYPGTGGDCGTTIIGGGNCTVVVEFAPTTLGAHADTLDFSYNDGLAAQNATRTVQGVSTAPAVLSVSGPDPYDYGSQPLGSTTANTFTLTNGGALTATGMTDAGALAAPYTYAGGIYPGTGGTCGGSLAPLANCTLVVEFSPTAPGVFNDSFQINYNDGAIPQVLNHNLTGTGIPPASLSISETDPYDFGIVTVSSTVQHTFVLTNGGSVTATTISEVGLSAPFRFVGGAYPGTGGTCTASLAAGANCNLEIEFAPTGSGLSNDTIDISYDSGAGMANVLRSVQGTGQGPATLTILGPDPYDFGTQPSGSTNNNTFTINNVGGTTATAMAGSGLAAPFRFVGGTYPGGGTCGTTLAAAGSCTVVVEYLPAAIGGNADTMTIDYNDGAAAQNTSVVVQGTSVAPASLSISETDPYDYGTLPTGGTAQHIFNVTNGGGFQATAMSETGLSTPFQYVGGAYPGTGGDCGTTLNAGASCTIAVEFAPPAPFPAYNDTISFTYNDGVNLQNALRDVTGVAVPPATLAISEAEPYNFGTLAIGAVAQHTFTVSNIGGVPATAMVEVGLAAPFSYVGGAYPGTGGTCGTTLNSGANCSIVLEFSPTASGIHNDSIDFSYNDGVAAQNSLRGIMGSGQGPAALSISGGDPYDFGAVPSGSVNATVFTVTNVGNTNATGMSGSGLSAPFRFTGGAYPGGGTCGTVLTPAASCTVGVEYLPVATGVDGDAMEINYHNGVAPQLATRNLTGQSLGAAVLTISETDPYDYGTLTPGLTAQHTFNVSNTGGFQATAMTEVGLAAPYNFLGGAYPGTGGNCGTTLNGGASCQIVVEYAPTLVSAGDNDTIDISYNDGVTAQNSLRDVTGVSVPPASLSISETNPFDYGLLAIGDSAAHTFTVSNGGGFTATAIAEVGITAPFHYVGGAYPGTGGTCGTTLAAGANCDLVIEYVPAGTGLDVDTIDVSYNNGTTATNTTRLIQGTGGNAATLSITDTDPYDYGSITVGTTALRTFTVTNLGDLQATSLGGTGLSAPFRFFGGAYPGTGGTCGTSLSAGLSCDVVVEFAPTVAIISNDTIDINYHDSITNQTSSRDVTGTGITTALLTISETNPYDYGSIANGATVNHAFTLTNGGASAATGINETGLGAPFGYLGGAFPGLGGNCGATLGAGANCLIVIEFNPSTLGVHNDTIDVAYNDGATVQNSTRDIQGTSLAPASLSVAGPDPYDYSMQAIGSSTQNIFTITNNGAVAATSMTDGGALGTHYTYVGGAYPGTGGTCGATLAPLANCDVVIAFEPLGTGIHNDDFQIDYDDGVTTQNMNHDLTGSAAPPASITIFGADPIPFGNVTVGATQNQTINILNVGGVAATGIAEVGLAAPYQFFGGAFPGTGGTCTTTLNGGAGCSMVVEFAPTVPGLANDALSLDYNDGAGMQNVSRNLQGTGLAPAVLTISETDPYDYGTVPNGSNNAHLFTVTNTGGTTATTIAYNGLAAPFVYNGGTCGATLAAGANCTLNVEYNPTVVSVLDNDTIEIDYNDGASPQTANRDVQGVSVAPALLTISETNPYDFGAVRISTSAQHTFTVTNTGGYPASSMSEGGLAAPFGYVGGAYPGTGGDCGTSLNGGSACTIVVEYAPTIVSGLDADTIDFSYNNGLGVQNSTRNIQGSAVTAALLSIIEGTTFDFGIVNSGYVRVQDLNIQNLGGSPATSVTLSGLAAPYSIISSTCGTTISVAGACLMQIRYAPTTNGAHPLTPSLDYYDGFSNQNLGLNLDGDGFANALTLSLVSPAASPGNDSTPTIRVGNALDGILIRLYDAAGCGSEVANGNVGGGITIDFNPALAEGTYQFHARAEDDYGNLTACSAASVTYEYDNTAPDPVTGLALSTNLTTSGSSSPTFSWTHSASVDRTDYEIGLSVSPAGGNDVSGWTSVGIVNNSQFTGLSLTQCTDYYVSVKTIDHVGLESTLAVDGPFNYDGSDPSPPSALVAGNDASPTYSADVTWSPASDACGIAFYEIEISEDTNGNLVLDPSERGNIVAWKNVGLVTNNQEVGLTLTSPEMYWTSVRATDVNGRVSTVADSPGWVIFDPLVDLPPMILWLDGADTTTIFDTLGRSANDPLFNGLVDLWQDKSGSANVHDFYPAVALDPNFNLTSKGVSFAGVATNLTTPDHPEINTGLVTQRNFNIVFETAADVNTRQVVIEEGDALRGMNIYIYNGNLYCGFHHTSNSGDGAQPFTSVSTPIAANTRYVVSWIFDYSGYAGPAGPDGTITCYVNGVVIGATTSTTRMFPHGGDIGIGSIDNTTRFEDNSTPSSGAYFEGEVYEVIFYENAPTGLNVLDTHLYLDDKWL